MNYQYFTDNNNQKFPLSTEALAFMQEQIKLAYGFADLAGANIIVREPTSSNPGLVIFDGELLPLTGTKFVNGAITIAEQIETMSVEGKFVGNVRKTRIASYTSGHVRVGANSQPRKLLSAFTTLKPIATLMAELDEAKQHHMPKGSIIDWYGECLAANVPYGFVPCGIVCKGLGESAVNAEVTAWRNKYPNIITVSSTYSRGWALRITECNGQVVPDLTGRFIVQAGCDYSLGDHGGAESVRLTAAQSGQPGSRIHSLSQTTGKAYSGTAASQHDCVNTLTWGTENAQDAVSAHENRPPYYALYKLIKVI